MKNLQNTIKKLIKEELYQRVMNDEQKIAFLKDVYENTDILLSDEKFIIDNAFKAYFINELNDIDKCNYMQLQDLYNSVENKVKTQNIRYFHYFSTDDRNVYLTDLVD